MILVDAGGGSLEIENGEVKEPCDHEWGDWGITKEATCTTPGRESGKCKL